jgi:hypothetical protein
VPPAPNATAPQSASPSASVERPETGRPGDLAERWRADLADLVTGDGPVARVEVDLRPQAGTPRWIRVTTAQVVLDGCRYLLSHVEDTTARRLAEQRVIELTDTARRAPERTGRPTMEVDLEAVQVTLLPDAAADQHHPQPFS